ncbi:hypothetical protein M5689_002272 [Euphorbia peplus]|nr:hypothetical protein M5689_002272 [Euphorbia peplus]
MLEEPHTYVGSLLSNLINSLPIEFEDLKTFWGFQDELNHLRQSLDAIAHLVEDAEDKQTVAGRWLRDLKQVAYQADDLLSELAYQTTRFKIRNQENFGRSVAVFESIYSGLNQ